MLVIAAVGVLVIASEQTWRTALFATVIATVIAATRVRFALHAAAALLVVLAVLAVAGAGVGAGHPVRGGSRPAGHVLTRAAARPAAGRAAVDPSAAAPSSSARSVMATSSYARDRAAQQELAIAIVLGTVVVLGSAVIAISWSLPMIAAWVHSGRVAHLGVLDALKALVNGRSVRRRAGERVPARDRRGCCRARGGSGAWPR